MDRFTEKVNEVKKQEYIYLDNQNDGDDLELESPTSTAVGAESDDEFEEGVEGKPLLKSGWREVET
jgi:hypothetical protein